jgi:autotransporter-associated beta strand protein
MACAIILLAGGITSALAQVTNTITLTNSDTGGTSSFTSGFGATNWDDGLAPFPATPPDVNAYVLTNVSLLTPPGSGSYVFAGDSLTLLKSAALGIKGYGTITVSNLTLAGGKIANSGTGGSPDTGIIAGNINVTAGSTLDGGATAGVTALNVMAPITGPSGLTIADNGTVILSANNTYVGSTTVSTNSTLQMGVANALTNGPGNGSLTLNPSTVAGINGAAFDLNGFDTTVQDPATGGGVGPATIFNSAVGKTNTLTVDTELTTRSFKGYIKDNNGTGGVLALTIISSGSGLWTIVTNSAYSGDTTVNSGTLSMGNSGNLLPWGPGKGNLIVNNTGKFSLGGRSPQINGLLGNGTVDNLSGAGLGLGGHSTLNFGSNDVSATFSGVIQNINYDGTDASPLGNPNNAFVQVTKFGAGTATWTGTNTFVGNVSVHAGVLRITCQNGDGVTGGGLGLGNGCPNGNWPASPSKVVTIDSSLGDAGVHFLATNGTPIVVSSDISFQIAGTNGAIVNEAGDNTINGAISLRTGSATTIRVDGDSLTLAGNINIISNTTSRVLTLGGVTNGIVNGVISDGASANNPNTNILSLTKSGAGIWTLANANTYSDVTTISGGTLQVNGSLGAASTVAVNSGTLAGSGTVGGGVTVSNGPTAIIHPGGGNTLTFGSNLTFNAGSSAIFDLSSTTSSGDDKVVLNGANSTLTCAGAQVTIKSAGTLAAADYVLFNVTGGSSVISGNFNSTPAWSGTTPANAASYSIVTSGQQVLLHYASGPGTFTNKTGITSFSIAGQNLVLNATNGQSGDAYYLLESTNVAQSLSLWKTVATNVLGVNGNYTFTGTNVVTPGSRQQFYTLSNTNWNH